MECENGIEDPSPSEEAEALYEETAPAVTLEPNPYHKRKLADLNPVERNGVSHERKQEINSSTDVEIADDPVLVAAAADGVNEGLKSEVPGIENGRYTAENLGEPVTLVSQEGNLTYDGQQSSHIIVPKINKKMESEHDKSKQAIWNDEFVQVFCGLCIKNMETRKQPSTHAGVKGWTTMVNEFAELTGQFYTKVQLKNKWDALKGEWKIWKQLKGTKTGLRWDPINKTIDASNEWWLKKLKAMPKARRFRKKGIPPEFEAILDRMFMNTVAIRDFVCTPSSSSLPQESHDSPKKVMIPTMSSDDSTEDIEPNRTVTEKEYRRSSSCMSNGKKRKMLSCTEKLFSKHIDGLCEVVGNKSISSSKNDNNFSSSISCVMEQLDTLSHIQTDLALYLFATRLFMSSEKREMFVAIKKPEFKIAWLKNERVKEPNL